MKTLASRLTSEHAVALVALFIALTAGAYAAGLERNSVKSKHIKDGRVMTQDLADAGVTAAKLADGAVGSSKIPDGAVGSAKVADGAVGSDKVPDSNVTGADAADDSLTGADIDESTLQGITASSASRVAGLELKEIDYQRPVLNGDVRSIVDFTGIFRIDAQCASVGDGLDITAFSAVPNSRISVIGYSNAIGVQAGTEEDATRSFNGAASVASFGPDNAFPIDNLLPSSGDRQHALIHFATQAGFVAVVDIATLEDTAPGGLGCKVTGNAMGG